MDAELESCTGKLNRSQSGEKALKTDFSIESLLRKQSVVVNVEQGSEDNNLTRLRLPQHFSSEQEISIGVDFETDQDSSSSSPEPARPIPGTIPGDSRYFGLTEADLTAFPWLSCTRFKPPKLPRSRKRVGCKRYGRGPRIPFAPHQIAVLESTFSKSQYLSSDCIHSLADTLHLSETRVKIWFQNRRARYRREREAATTSLTHDNTSGDHCHAQFLAHDQHSSMGQSSYTGQPLDLCRTLEPKTFEQFMTNASAGGEGSSSERRKLIFPDLIAQQLQRYREVQEYFLQQEQHKQLDLIRYDSEGHVYSSPSVPKNSSILQTVLQATPPLNKSPFQLKTFPAPESEVKEIDSRDSSSLRHFMQFDSIYHPSPPTSQHYQPFSIQFR